MTTDHTRDSLNGRPILDVAADHHVSRQLFVRRVRKGWTPREAATTEPLSSALSGRRSRRSQRIGRIGSKFTGRGLSPEAQAVADERARRLLMVRESRMRLVGDAGFTVTRRGEVLATAVDLFAAMAVAKRAPGSEVRRSDGALIASTKLARDVYT